MHRAIQRASALLAIAWLGGCDDDTAPNRPADGPSADGPLADAAPPGEPGFVIHELALEERIGPELSRDGVGFDLTGDGVPDNVFGLLSPFTNPMLAAGIADGSLIVLLRLEGYGPMPDDDALRVVLYRGVDADGEPGNNLGGMGQLLTHPDSFFDDGMPRATMAASVRAGVLTAMPTDRIELLRGIPIERPRLRAVVRSAEGPIESGVLAGAVASCTAHAIAVVEGTSLLELLLRPPGGLLAIQPDVDVDGDGFERIEVDGMGKVSRCIDGNGSAIAGPLCPCDPAMRDGYSIHLRFGTRSARIVGRAPADGGT